MNNKKILVISDVDGCLTDGKFIYTEDGKVAKLFGAHDNDGVKLLKNFGVDIQFISADKRGFNITKRRIEDMGCNVELVVEKERSSYIKKKLNGYDIVIFFGDGIGDFAAALDNLNDIVFIAPNNALPIVKDAADFVTNNSGGEGAFFSLAEIVLSNYLNVNTLEQMIMML
jgi:YrbI family 3-deoxy-D-manno-octulosonate 8-phosphate phosphatase